MMAVGHSNKQSKAGIIARKFFLLSALCVFSLAVGATNAVAIDLDPEDIPTIEPDNPVKPVDPNKCNITEDMTVAWIANNPLTAALNKAYKEIDAQWDKLNDDQFGHPKSTNVSGTKAEAKALLDAHRAALWAMSVKIAGKLVPACDECQSVDNWGKLKWFAHKRSDGQSIGSNKVNNLTRAQVDNNKVMSKLSSFMAVRELRAAAPDYPSSAGYTQKKTLDKQCQVELAKDNPDPDNCNTKYLARILDTLERSLTKALASARASDSRKVKMSSIGSSSLQCEPSSNYGDIAWSRVP